MKRRSPRLRKAASVSKPALTRPSRSLIVNLSPSVAYRRLCDVLLRERGRIETHNPPVDASFYLFPKTAWANFGLRMAYPGTFTLTPVSNDTTRIAIELKPRLRIRRNLHALIPVAIATAAFGVWGLGVSTALVAIAIGVVKFRKPGKSLEAITSRLEAAIAEDVAKAEAEAAEAAAAAALLPAPPLPPLPGSRAKANASATRKARTRARA